MIGVDRLRDPLGRERRLASAHRSRASRTAISHSTPTRTKSLVATLRRCRERLWRTRRRRRDGGCRDIAASPRWCSRSCSRPARRTRPPADRGPRPESDSLPPRSRGAASAASGASGVRLRRAAAMVCCGRANVGHRRPFSIFTQSARNQHRPHARGSQPCAQNTTALLVAIDLLAFLVAFLRLHRERGDRAGFQPLQRDRLAGLLAIAVGVVLDALQRRVDLGDQLALAVAGAQFDRAVGFRRGAVGEIGMIDVLFLQGLQRDLAIPSGFRPSTPAAWRENNRAGGRS